MSDTVESGGRVIGRPGPGGGGGRGNGAGGLLARGLGAFARQREATVLVVTVAMLLYFGISHFSTFVSKANAIDLLSEIFAGIAIIAIGEVLLLICGQIDLSVGFIYQLAPFTMLFTVEYYHFPPWLGVIAGLLTGLIAGWVNGFLVVTLGLPAFIATLGTGFVLNGMALSFSHAEPLTPTPAIESAGKYIGTSPWSQFIWAAVLLAIFHVVLTRTRWGLYTISAGGNLLGAREAGINVGRIVYGNFMITGVLGALVGLQVAFYDTSIDPTAGGFTPMFYSVTAAVIGGTAMLGGSGTILGAALGALMLSTLIDGFDILGISANILPVIFGAAVLVAMFANVQLARLRGSGGTL